MGICCASDEVMKAACVGMRRQLLIDNGLDNAVSEIKKFVKEKLDTELWQAPQESLGPCAGQCGFVRASWHPTHCCKKCERSPGNHGQKCARVAVQVPTEAPQETLGFCA